MGWRLIRVCRLVRRRQPRFKAYLRLKPVASPSSSPSSPSCQREIGGKKTLMGAKIASWYRSLARRLGPLSFQLRERRGATTAYPASTTAKEGSAEGHLPVYVAGKDFDPPRRVLVPVIFFNHPLFVDLLRRAEEEFGFHHQGGSPSLSQLRLRERLYSPRRRRRQQPPH
ncbi:unnamed protein product [Spirodela intermedia]|uniref:Small auxin up regulated protein n=1 Tax=Spirodela intermedia TaxID=51605 RepID=A0A7I8IF08_SPIIN|nr:unnamed protein product [Spirodela intermedia]CAA6656201.1 unnamed protein product [Spirodela intermedia]